MPDLNTENPKVVRPEVFSDVFDSVDPDRVDLKGADERSRRWAKSCTAVRTFDHDG
jgi:hypothetical protein